MFKRLPKVNPIIETVESFQPPTPIGNIAVGDVNRTEAHPAEAANAMMAVLLARYHVELMTAAKLIREAMPSEMYNRDQRIPCMSELYGVLGQMYQDVCRLRGEPVVKRERK